MNDTSTPTPTEINAGARAAANWRTLLAELQLPAGTDPAALARSIRSQRLAISDARLVVHQARCVKIGDDRQRYLAALVRVEQILIDAARKATPPAGENHGQQS